jgi:4-diphosphocytidyl-2-C-methyl-D-erythritol kinase
MESAYLITWPAPGKLNRFLRILGRRPDGYHRLQTVFQFIDRCDYLSFEPRSDGLICREGEIAGVQPDSDLAVKAAHLLRRIHGEAALGVTIRIEKCLPLGSGLGGGSSDAATTLVALNHCWGCGLNLEQLAQLGLRLGADVPVFVHGRAAWAEGVGEQLTPIELDEPWFLVLTPACTVSTAAVFNDPHLTRDSQPVRITKFLISDIGNDCEAVVYERYPGVAAAARWLSQYARAQLTGTGACVFAAFPDRQAADRLVAQLPEQLSGFVTRGLNRSPLHERLGGEVAD